jgi:ankyrin repeat protein
MFAIQKQNEKLVKLLLDKGANVDVKDIVIFNYIIFIQDGFTPLSVAVDTRNKNMINLVLSAKPQIDVYKLNF